MATIKAIPTIYNGYKFRSRLEARYAVFFDALGITYEYEKEGYNLGKTGYYLPDFWLPELHRWVEIKGKEPTSQEKEKACALFQAGYPVGIFPGLPGCVGLAWYSDVSDSSGGDNEEQEKEWQECPGCGAIDFILERGSHSVVSWYAEESIDNCTCDERKYNVTPSNFIQHCAELARQADFKNGKNVHKLTLAQSMRSPISVKERLAFYATK